MYGLTQEEINGCRDAFLAFDKDHSGTIDQRVLRYLPPLPQQQQQQRSER